MITGFITLLVAMGLRVYGVRSGYRDGHHHHHHQSSIINHQPLIINHQSSIIIIIIKKLEWEGSMTGFVLNEKLQEKSGNSGFDRPCLSCASCSLSGK
jgi:ribosomal protein L35AE/L33A